jgi:hypothetical protein
MNKLALADRVMEKPRKTIQVMSVLDSVGKYLVLAVCDDGTIWQLANLYREHGKEPYWEKFPTPPAL